MRALLLTILGLIASAAHAQHQGQSAWLNVDYTYSQYSYKESNVTQKGNLAGVRGDVGLGLLDNFGVSVGGQYQDGNLNYDGMLATGSNAQLVTSDYFKETYALANFFFGPITLSGGLASREWYNNLHGYYRRRESAQYFPVTAMYYQSGFYLKGEVFTWKSGHVQMYMHDFSAAEQNTDLNQGSGNGWGAEIGYMIPNALHAYSRIYLAYRRWDIGATETVSDSVRNLSVAAHTMEILQGGVGISF